MDPVIGIYNPAPIYAGDTWPGIPAIQLRSAGSPPAVACASARLVFFRASQTAGKPQGGCDLKSPGEITVSNATTWEFVVPPQPLALEAGEWTLQFKTQDASGTVKTWFTGVMTIL
jgi:hypothetical protein